MNMYSIEFEFIIIVFISMQEKDYQSRINIKS